MNIITSDSECSLMDTVLPDDHFPSDIGVDSSTGLIKSSSPLSAFLVDEEAESTCPLLTPSPPTECNHPLSSDIPPGVAYERQISPSSIDNMEIPSLTKLNGNATPGYGGIVSNEHNNNHGGRDCQPVFVCQNNDPNVEESSSSSSSVLQEQTVCAQLLSSHLYQHLTKSNNTDSFTSQENGGIPPITGIQLAIRKSPDDFCFLNWNWCLIRKMSFWGYIALLIGCVGVVIGLMTKLPVVCNPTHGWWQGSLFYEVFPASFQDSNSDGIGDFYGLSVRAPYLESLGVRAVRLNFIFSSNHYPENYNSVNNLTTIDPALGNIRDFDHTIATLHKHNISVILDLPVHPFVNHFIENDVQIYEELVNITDNHISPAEREKLDVVSQAIKYWLEKGIDGFYLKELEVFVEEPNFASMIKQWRKLVDQYSRLDHEKILMCSIDVLEALNPNDIEKVNAILNRMDLMDVKLDAWTNGTAKLKDQVDSFSNGILYSKPGYPWIHWHLGSVDTQRVSSQLGSRNTSLALVMFQLMLPGTPSIFYGDEIGLKDSTDTLRERQDLSHLHQLAPMQWNMSAFTTANALPWLSPALTANIDKQRVVAAIARLRIEAPPIYMNGVWKDHQNVPNTEIRLVTKDVMIVERRYPRRHSYVLVVNFGEKTVSHDLSVHYFGGEVMVDLRGRIGQYVTFRQLQLYPGEGVIIKLDK